MKPAKPAAGVCGRGSWGVTWDYEHRGVCPGVCVQIWEGNGSYFSLLGGRWDTPVWVCFDGGYTHVYGTLFLLGRSACQLLAYLFMLAGYYNHSALE